MSRWPTDITGVLEGGAALPAFQNFLLWVVVLRGSWLVWASSPPLAWHQVPRQRSHRPKASPGKDSTAVLSGTRAA